LNNQATLANPWRATGNLADDSFQGLEQHCIQPTKVR
jgi:hypothetical protein